MLIEPAFPTLPVVSPPPIQPPVMPTKPVRPIAPHEKSREHERDRSQQPPRDDPDAPGDGHIDEYAGSFDSSRRFFDL